MKSVTLTPGTLLAVAVGVVALALLVAMPFTGAPLWATLLGAVVALIGTTCVLTVRCIIAKAVESTLDGLALVLDFGQRGPRPPAQAIQIRRRNDA